ncbi:hypothetical protein PENSPDRAFT_690533 [Peniophora sp. CONT]|nr:hypothetical protein PENSPDRAFT_690533 [Peniophora sp. CONT]
MDQATAITASASVLDFLESLASDDEQDEDREAFLQNVAFIADLVVERRKRRAVDADEQPPPPPKKRKSAGDNSSSSDKLAAEARKRADAFLHEALDAITPAIGPSVLADLIVQDNRAEAGNQVRKHASLEDAALHRALVGFTPPPADDNSGASWTNIPRFCLASAPAGGALPVLHAYCQRSLSLDREDSGADLERRVRERGSWLGTDPLGGARWVTNTIQKIEVLRFDRDYDTLIAGEGGKGRQLAMLDKLFRAWLPSDKKDVDIKTAEGSKLKDSFRALFDAQRRARNRLRELYDNLGPSVLIDPFWTVDTCFHHRSKPFTKLIALVFEELTGDPDNDAHSLQMRYADNHRTLRSLADHLGGPVLEEYVAAFLRDQPSLPGKEIEESLTQA